MTRTCPIDGAELHLHYVGYVMNYYDCPKCGLRFKGFAGDSDVKPEEKK